MATQRIVLTGCSGSGKTTLLELLKNHYRVFPEVASELIANGYEAPINSSIPSNVFPSKVLSARIQYFITSKNEQVSIFDRGIPDALGFSYYLNKEVDEYLLNAIEQYRYTHILLFPPWEEIFTNNEIRKETFSEAVEMFENIKKAYKNSGYQMTIVPKLELSKRLEFINDFIAKF